MERSNKSMVSSPESQLQVMSTPSITGLSKGEGATLRNRNSVGKNMGRWSSLALLLLCGGLVEVSLGRASLAQLNDGPWVGQSAEAIVLDPAKGREAVDNAAASPETPPAPKVVPEVIVIPKAQASSDDSEAAESEAIAPPLVIEESSPPDPSPQETEAVSTEAAPADTSEDLTEGVVPDKPEVVEIDNAEAEIAARVYLAEKQISFIPPIGFTAMSPVEIKAKFPQDMPPRYAYANETRDVSVGITVSDIPLEAEQLPAVKIVLEDFLETSVPGFQWLDHDFVNLGGQDWIKLEFISQIEDQRIHNDMYITSLQGKLLGFNFNANLAVDFSLRDLLQASRNSILLNETVASDEGLIP